MNKEVIALGLGFALFFGMVTIVIDITPTVVGTIITVDDDGPADHSKIQDAINASKDGDTVFVFNGTYYENVIVNKTINLTGENKSTTIIDGNQSGDVVFINAGWVNVSEFTVRNSGSVVWPDYDAGFEILSGNNTISDNIICNNLIGFFLYSSNNNISDNIIDSSSGPGFYLYNSSHNYITNNNVTNTGGIGLVVSSNCNRIVGNTITGSGGIGIFGGLMYSNEIINNTIFGNGTGAGIYIDDTSMPSPGGWGSFDHVIWNNTIFNHSVGINLYVMDAGIIRGVEIISSQIYDNEIGISFDCSGGGIFETTISNCTIKNNDIGIDMYQISGGNDIINNNFSKNNGHAISLNNSRDNRIYHNYFFYNNGGGVQVHDNGNSNFWNDSYPTGGNFWSDYIGTDNFIGPNQDVPGSDEIGDTPYFIDSDSQDNYPLISTLGNCTFLHEGWNLVSIPFIQSDTGLDSVLSDINGFYDAVQWYDTTDTKDHWKHNHTSKPPHLNDLDSMHHKMGFWVHITEPGGIIFEYPGTPPAENQSFVLHPGWNLVGYPSLTRHNRTDGLNNLTFGDDINAIWSFNAAAQKWEELEETDYFAIGKGYWIQATTQCMWEVPL